MVWQVFSYDQEDTLAGSAALAGHQGGACLAISMKWCAWKKMGRSSLHFPDSVATEDQKLALAGIMIRVQDSVLQDMFGAQRFKHYDAENEAITTARSAKGQINNAQAYAHRLEKMSQWAQTAGLALQDDRVGFPGGGGGWIPEMLVAAFSKPHPILGLISLTGKEAGHSMAYEYVAAPYEKFNFFDPNYGEYRSTSKTEFMAWITRFLQEKYAELSEHGGR